MRRKQAEPAEFEGQADPALQGPLQQYVGYALRRAQLAVFQDVIATLADVDLRPAQFSVLILVDANPGIVQSHASASLGIQKANFVPLLTELERRGLIDRVAVDGRTNGLFLTRKGRATLKRANALHTVHHARVDAIIGTENREQLIEICLKLAELAR
ncbi:MAG: winged helix-turn-helix transcriptional regulator [Candidatus Eremiobacteraeota bacterium]|nr:winged helix-turn-helix transcriptional regulator [Candidatus Eremiobacteraeota bacterium]